MSVLRPSKIFWVGVLLKKNEWIHTGVGLHNDITVTFDNETTKEYNYLVAHGVSGTDDKFKVHLSFAIDLSEIYLRLAEAFDTEIQQTFPPVFAGDTWTTNKIAKDVVTLVENFLGMKFNMSFPDRDETNCVHFSVATYLFFANKDKSKQTEIMGKVGHLIRQKNYQELLKQIKTELNQVSPSISNGGDSGDGGDSSDSDSCIIL